MEGLDTYPNFQYMCIQPSMNQTISQEYVSFPSLQDYFNTFTIQLKLVKGEKTKEFIPKTERLPQNI